MEFNLQVPLQPQHVSCETQMRIIQCHDRSAGKSRLLMILADELDYLVRRCVIPDHPDHTSRSPPTAEQVGDFAHRVTNAVRQLAQTVPALGVCFQLAA